MRRFKLARPIVFAVPTLLLLVPACGDDDASSKDAAVDSGRGSDDKDAASYADSGSSDAALADAMTHEPAGATDGDHAVSIRFKAVVGDQAFACGKSYDGVGTPARTMSPVDFRFYVHDVLLVTRAGKDVVVELEQDGAYQYKNVAMLDFENHKGECDQGDAPTHTTITGVVPNGQYAGVKFTLGIPQKLNHADLSTQPSPLNKSSLFWGWNYGHIFFAATSRVLDLTDVDAGLLDDDSGVSSAVDHFTHVGATGCDGNPSGGVGVTKCTSANQPGFSLKLDPDKQAIVVDFAAVKAGSDLAAEGCHSFMAPTCTAPFAHLGIDFATGKYTPKSQTVFSAQ